MFETLGDYSIDPIMAATERFMDDPRSDKLNLTVGVYQDETGNTPILAAVKRAEEILTKTQVTKAYTPLTGDAAFCDVLGAEMFGAQLYRDSDVVAAQTAGGAVALRIAADMIADLPGQPTVWVQTPTFSNYIPILTAAGANWGTVPYYDSLKREIEFDAMLEALQRAKRGDLFLVQGPCHNPTGADMSETQFDALLDLLESQGVVPWLDLAYIGFAKGFIEDCTTARKIMARFPEAIVCVTMSKCFGMYRDRAGALFLKTTPGERVHTAEALTAIIRAGASHAPDHGPSVVRTILQDPELKALWLDELEVMRQRVAGLRQNIVDVGHASFQSDTLAYLTGQTGMFSLLPLTPEQELRLQEDAGVFLVEGGRMNVARLGQDEIAGFIQAVLDVRS